MELQQLQEKIKADTAKFKQGLPSSLIETGSTDDPLAKVQMELQQLQEKIKADTAKFKQGLPTSFIETSVENETDPLAGVRADMEKLQEKIKSDTRKFEKNLPKPSSFMEADVKDRSPHGLHEVHMVSTKLADAFSTLYESDEPSSLLQDGAQPKEKSRRYERSMHELSDLDKKLAQQEADMQKELKRITSQDNKTAPKTTHKTSPKTTHKTAPSSLLEETPKDGHKDMESGFKKLQAAEQNLKNLKSKISDDFAHLEEKMKKTEASHKSTKPEALLQESEKAAPQKAAPQKAAAPEPTPKFSFPKPKFTEVKETPAEKASFSRVRNDLGKIEMAERMNFAKFEKGVEKLDKTLPLTPMTKVTPASFVETSPDKLSPKEQEDKDWKTIQGIEAKLTAMAKHAKADEKVNHHFNKFDASKYKAPRKALDIVMEQGDIDPETAGQDPEDASSFIETDPATAFESVDAQINQLQKQMSEEVVTMKRDIDHPTSSLAQSGKVAMSVDAGGSLRTEK